MFTNLTVRSVRGLRRFLNDVHSVRWDLDLNQVRFQSNSRFSKRFGNISVVKNSELVSKDSTLALSPCFSCSILKYHDSHQTRGIRIYSATLAQTDKDDDENVLGKGEKVLNVKVPSTRLDAVLKAGLGLSRNKIEKVLYEDRLRVNGGRPAKKSQAVKEDDEIDVVRGYNKLNPNFIDVSRVEVDSIGAENEESDDPDTDDEGNSKIPVVLRRSKLLTIKNYSVPWKGNNLDD